MAGRLWIACFALVMTNNSVASLVYVARVSGQRLRELGECVEQANGRRVEGLLRSLTKEADTLSACLARLSQFVDVIAEDGKAEVSVPKVDPNLLQIVAVLKNVDNLHTCERCGGLSGFSPHMAKMQSSISGTPPAAG